jgi:RNA polymerase sigma-70 factor (ECF subfamily)
MGGDLDDLMAVLAPDVVLVSDGGGKAQAALHPIMGAAKVARFLRGISGLPYMGIDPSDIAAETMPINGGTGMLFTAQGRILAAVTVAAADNQITAIQVVANPDKLRGVSASRPMPI